MFTLGLESPRGGCVRKLKSSLRENKNEKLRKKMAQSKATESYLGGSQGSEKCQATKCGSVAPAILSCLIHSSAAYHPHPYLTLFLRQARVPQALISRPSCPCALNLLPTLSCLDQPHLIFKSYPQCLFLQEVFPDNHKIGQGPPPWAPTASQPPPSHLRTVLRWPI